MNLDDTIFAPLNNLMHIESYQAIYSEITCIASAICAAISDREKDAAHADQRIVAYVDAHYHETMLSITALQDIFGISANTINKSIKSATGQTFLPYLTKRRMEEAKQLLMKEEAKISNVSRLVGYENEYSFRRTFLHYTGVKAQDFKAITEEKETASS